MLTQLPDRLYKFVFSYHRASLPKLIDSINNVHFTSHSGRDVRFDAFGNVPSAYDIYNHVKHPTNEGIRDHFNHMSVCMLSLSNHISTLQNNGGVAVKLQMFVVL